MNDGLQIVLTIVVVLALVGVTYFLARIVIKEIIVNRQERSLHIEGLLTKSEMNGVINAYISRIQPGTSFSLIYVDLDKFGDLNEVFGQKEGNIILENIAKRIKKILPKSAKISRYYGDEFLIFLNNQFNQKQVADIAYKILDELRKKTKVSNSTEIDLTGSIAVAFYPIHGKNTKRLLESLKIAIFQAKKMGGNTLKIYSDDLKYDEESVDYFYQIKHAIEKREFQLYFQPMVNVKEHKVFGFEALLRWNHPTLGVLLPDKFINIMEQTGDIHWVGNWGLESIIKTIYELKAMSEGYEDIKMSINLSPKQLLREDIAQEFNKILKRHKGDPKHIILEIGEFALFEKQEQIFSNLVKLSELGFSIAVDGLSLDIATINRLQKIKADIIKIRYQMKEDEVFERKYLELLLEFAKEKNKLIIIEYVDNEEVIQTFLPQGIEVYQGFYFSAPLPFVEVNEFKNKYEERYKN